MLCDDMYRALVGITPYQEFIMDVVGLRKAIAQAEEREKRQQELLAGTQALLEVLRKSLAAQEVKK